MADTPGYAVERDGHDEGTLQLALAWEERWRAAKGGRVNLSELCRASGISRETGYYWLRRYQEANRDVRALEGRSRRPLTTPTTVSEEMQDFVCGVRSLYPHWGPRKLQAWLVDKYPGQVFPSPSTMGEILKRRGLRGTAETAASAGNTQHSAVRQGQG
jgi:hypothetical protein